MLQLFHWTPTRNLSSIQREGLDPKYSQGKLRAIWGCVEGRVSWALEHVSFRHETKPHGLTLLSFALAPERAQEHERGLFYTGWVLSWGLVREVPTYGVRSFARALGMPDSTLRGMVARGAILPSYSHKGTPIFTDVDLLHYKSGPGASYLE